MRFRACIQAMVWGLTALFLAAAASPAASAADAPLRIAYPDFQPFHWRDDQNRMHGFFHDIVVEALDHRLGIPTVWESLPWPRCQASVRSGEADAMITVPTAERAEYAVASPTPFYVKRLNVFTRAGHSRLPDIRSLRTLEDISREGFTVVTYNENGWSEAHVEPLGITVHKANTLRGVWRMLAGGRGDLVIEWPPAAWPDIRAEGLERAVVQTDAVVASMDFHLLVGRRSGFAGILTDFSRIIREMRQDGTMQRILATYHLDR